MSEPNGEQFPRMNDNETIIEANGIERQYWRDVWKYRELLYFLAWRDLLVRYKQTVAGVAWAVVKPLLTTIIFTVLFGRIAKLPSGGVEYPLLVMSGMLPWTFFSTAVSESGNSLVSNAGVISKVYFPRLIVPASSLVTTFADLTISAMILACLMTWYGHVPGPQVFLLPLFIVVAAAAALGAGLWLSALMVKYRDVRYIVPFAVQIGFFISPVGINAKVIPEKWQLLYSLNPMVGVINGFRWCILGGEQTIYWPGFLFSMLCIVLLIVFGLMYFRHTERGFADVI